LTALKVSFRSILGVTILIMIYLIFNAIFPFIQSYYFSVIYSLTCLGGIPNNLEFARRGKTDFDEKNNETTDETPTGTKLSVEKMENTVPNTRSSAVATAKEEQDSKGTPEAIAHSTSKDSSSIHDSVADSSSSKGSSDSSDE
jgi:hypothetical protein